PFVQKVLDRPKVRRLFVRDVTPESEGNAVGIGMADMTTRRLVDKINYQAMHMNAITSGVPEGARIPMAFETDREAIQVALGMIGLTPPEKARIVRITNTLHLAELDVSEPLLSEVKAHERLSLVTQPAPLVFDDTGNLPPF
ncbi:MAG: [Fe-S]-binding protein, partial [candidate division NC10 bacterium]